MSLRISCFVILALMGLVLVSDCIAQSPQLRAVLQPDSYIQRRDQALNEIGDWSVLENSKAPVIGVRITNRTSGMVADQLGMNVGDVLVAVDQEVIWGGSTKLNGIRSQQLQFYLTAANEIRTVSVQTEKLGVSYELYWRPELAFLRGRQRSEAFDRDFLVAAIMRGKDSDLAETALKRSLEAGYRPDELSHQLALEIALLQNRPEVAQHFADVLAEQFERDSTIHPILILRAALANGNFALARRVLEFQGRMYRRQVDLAAYSKAEEWATRVHLDESSQEEVIEHKLQAMLPIDLSSTMKGASFHSIKTGLPPLLREGMSILRAEAGEVNYLLFQPPAPVLSFDTSISMRMADFAVDESGATSSSIKYSIWSSQVPEDLRPAALQAPQLVQIHFSNSSSFEVQFANMRTDVQIFDSSLTSDSSEKRNVRFLRLGSRLAVYLNGHRILLAPAADTIVPLAIEARLSGMQVELSDMKFRELVELAPE